MRANDLVGAHAPKKWRRGRPDAGGLPDLLQRNFVASAPNQRWVADVTEFACGDGKLYLAGIRDLFHRGIVGWDTSGRQDSTLVVSALTMALARTGNPTEVIHHADKGSIYTSLDFAFAAGNADMTLSFGSTGDAYDNAAMETFWARLKVEINWIRGSIWFPTRADAHPTHGCGPHTGSETDHGHRQWGCAPVHGRRRVVAVGCSQQPGNPLPVPAHRAPRRLGRGRDQR